MLKEEWFMYEDEIKKMIPEYFYRALGGEFVSIYGADALIKDKDEMTVVEYAAGTRGHIAAFNMTCRKLNMTWLSDYYSKLSWEKSDEFDDIVIKEVLRIFNKTDGNYDDSYFKYLLKEEGDI
jgi:hypothetical protein